jgi:hypothetical protein
MDTVEFHGLKVMRNFVRHQWCKVTKRSRRQLS